LGKNLPFLRSETVQLPIEKTAPEELVDLKSSLFCCFVQLQPVELTASPAEVVDFVLKIVMALVSTFVPI
jgi:hypothetical protein